jgi:hypothetical protein
MTNIPTIQITIMYIYILFENHAHPRVKFHVKHCVILELQIVLFACMHACMHALRFPPFVNNASNCSNGTCNSSTHATLVAWIAIQYHPASSNHNFGGCTHVLHASLPIKLISLILFMPWKEPNSNTYSH